MHTSQVSIKAGLAVHKNTNYQILMKPTFLMLLLSLTMTSCLVTTQAVTVNERTNEDDILLYHTSAAADAPYTEKVHFELTGSVWTPREKLKKRLVQQAQKHGCDAVINVRFKTTFIWPQAYGVGIVYTDQ